MKSHICPIKELRHYPIGNEKPQRDLKQGNNMLQMHLTKRITLKKGRWTRTCKRRRPETGKQEKMMRT